MKIRTALLATILLTAPVAALAADAPPAPAEHPDWRQVSAKGVEIMTRSLIDPASAEIDWTSGFQWGFVKEPLRRRDHVWIACGTINAKNRFGGYVGAKPFIVWVAPEGNVMAADAALLISTCDNGPKVPAGPEMARVTAREPAISVADELRKLAELRDSGVITAAEFEAQKAKLLAL